MSEPQACSELPGSIVESFTLAIELAGDQVKRSPETLAKILNNPAVQAKIKEALEKRLGELQAKAINTGRPIDADQALSQISNVFTTDTLDVTSAEFKKELEKSAKYRQLKAGLEGLKCKFKASPRGFFYDEAEGVLLILTVGVMVASAAGMYVAATGDVDTLTGLAGKIAEQPSITVLGKVDLGLTDIVLKPSEKKYDGGIYARVSKWKAIEKAELKVVVQTKDEKVAAIPISVETKVNITPRWFGSFGAGYEPMAGKATFALGIVGKLDALEVQVKANYEREDKFKKLQSYGLGGQFDWKPAAAGPLNVTGGIGYSRVEEQLPGPPIFGGPQQTIKNDFKFNLGLKVEF